MRLRAPQPRLSTGAILSMVDRYLERALDFFEKKKYENALVDIEAAISLAGHSGELHATKGYMLLVSGETEGIEEELAKGLKIDPRQWIAHYTRGMMAYNEAEFDDALGHFWLAYQIAPERPEIFIYRAACFFHKGNKEYALDEINAAIELLPENDKRLKEARSWQKTIKAMK